MNRREHHDLMVVVIESGFQIEKLNILKTEVTGIAPYPKTHEAHRVVLGCLNMLAASLEEFKNAAREEIQITGP